MKKISSLDLKKMIIDILKEHKASKIKAINIKKFTDIADQIIVCTANSTTHAKALTEKVVDGLKAKHIKPISFEGENTREWMLIDYGDIVVHIMLKATREFYGLEALWELAKQTRIKVKTKKSHAD